MLGDVLILDFQKWRCYNTQERGLFVGSLQMRSTGLGFRRFPNAASLPMLIWFVHASLAFRAVNMRRWALVEQQIIWQCRLLMQFIAENYRMQNIYLLHICKSINKHRLMQRASTHTLTPSSISVSSTHPCDRALHINLVTRATRIQQHLNAANEPV